GEPAARLSRRRARLRHRQPDPRRPRAEHHPAAHEQSEEDRGNRGLRADRRRPGADRGGAERREPALSRGEAAQAGPPAPPPGPAIRARGERMSDEFDERRVGGAEAVEAPPEQQLEPDEAASESVLPPAETFDDEQGAEAEPERAPVPVPEAP